MEKATKYVFCNSCAHCTRPEDAYFCKVCAQPILHEYPSEWKPAEIEMKTETVIKDSGNRTEFETGAVRDIQTGKGRCDLLPFDVLARMFADDIFSELDTFRETGAVVCLLNVLEEAPVVLRWDNAWDMVLEVAKHFEDGAEKYGENNWQKGIPVSRYIDSAVRHYLKYMRGDTDEPHDRAFVWNIMCAAWTCEHLPDLNEYANAI